LLAQDAEGGPEYSEGRGFRGDNAKAEQSPFLRQKITSKPLIFSGFFVISILRNALK